MESGTSGGLAATASNAGESPAITLCQKRYYCALLRPNIDENDVEIDDVVSGFFGGSSTGAAAAARFGGAPCLREAGLEGAAGAGAGSAPDERRWAARNLGFQA